MMLGVGVALGAYFALQISMVLLASEPDMRGRALGLTGMAVGMTPLGTFTVGAVADVLDPPTAIAINAGVGILLFIPIVLLTPIARSRLIGADTNAAAT